MNTKTKLTALLMSILMVVAMIPAFALTVSADEIPATAVVALIKQDTTTYYDTFQEAWQEFKSDANKALNYPLTIKLLKNTNMGATGYGSSQYGADFRMTSLILDLNGFVLGPPTNDTSGCQHFYLNNDITLTIKDSNPKQSHWYSVDSATGLYTWVEAAETDATARTGLVEICGGALVGGKFTNNTGYYPGGSIAVTNAGATLNVLGGNFIGNQGYLAGAILNKVGGTLNISGGLFIGNLQNSTYSDETTIYVDGTNAASSITGGTFVGGASAQEGGASAAIGTYIPEGYTWVKNNKYTNAYSVVPAIKFMGVQRSNNIGEGDSASYSLRLVATVKESLLEDGNAFAGFNIAVNGDEAKLASNFYYTQLNAQGVDGLNKVITPKYDGYVLIAVVIEAIPVDTNSDMTLTVTPYLTVDTVEQSPVRSANVVLSGTNEPVVTWAN